MAKKTTSELKERLARFRSASWETRCALGEAAARAGAAVDVHFLFTLLDSRLRNTRAIAFDALKEFGGAAARLAARICLGDPWDLLRSDGARLLGNDGVASDVPRLIVALEDRAWTVRSSAADALGALGDRRAVKPLLRHVAEDRHPVVRRDAANAVGDLGAVSALSALREALRQEKNVLARGGIYYALYHLDPEEPADPLLSLLRDPWDVARHNGVNALQTAGLRGNDRAAAIQALEALIQDEPNPGVREDARKALEMIRGIPA